MNNDTITCKRVESQPRQAAVRHPSTDAWVIVTFGEAGYRELGPRDHSPAFDGDAFNAERGVTAEIAQAMLAGSMFGWNCPAAKAAQS